MGTNTEQKGHKDLIVWQKSMNLVVAVYNCTDSFPASERFGLVSQMRRAAVSVPSNIAEGYRRGTKKDYRNFLIIAFGSASELDTQLDIAVRTKMTTTTSVSAANALVEEVLKMLNKMIRTLDEPTTPYALPTTH